MKFVFVWTLEAMSPKVMSFKAVQFSKAIMILFFSFAFSVELVMPLITLLELYM